MPSRRCLHTDEAGAADFPLPRDDALALAPSVTVTRVALWTPRDSACTSVEACDTAESRAASVAGGRGGCVAARVLIDPT